MLAAAIAEWGFLATSIGGALAAIISAINAQGARKKAEEAHSVTEEVKAVAEDTRAKVENGD